MRRLVAPALAARARIAERLGYSGASLGLLRQARRLRPDDLALAMSYARVARNAGAAGFSGNLPNTRTACLRSMSAILRKSCATSGLLWTSI